MQLCPALCCQVLEAADAMRSRAKQAADAATSFEPAMADSYIRSAAQVELRCIAVQYGMAQHCRDN